MAGAADEIVCQRLSICFAANRDMHAVGGATFVSSLMNEGLVDALRLVVRPIVLGAGKALFKDVKERHALKLLDIKPMKPGKVRLTYAAI